MIALLDKLLTNDENKYILARAGMVAIDKVANMKKFSEVIKEKMVTDVLNLVLDGTIKYQVELPTEKGKEE